jgi:hypothetical protein
MRELPPGVGTALILNQMADEGYRRVHFDMNYVCRPPRISSTGFMQVIAVYSDGRHNYGATGSIANCVNRRTKDKLNARGHR